MLMNGRLDGHIVQGHIDTTAFVWNEKNWMAVGNIVFNSKSFAHLVIEKGSIAVNGTSLTCFRVGKDRFTVAVIPYTFEHTNISKYKKIVW